MDFEHFVAAAARVVEFAVVAVLLLGAPLAAAALSRRLVRRATFQTHRFELGKKYEKLPAGWKFEAKVLSGDLSWKPPLE